MMGIALLMASCTDDYKDWADPITNGPEDPIGVGITVSPAAAIDFATTTAETIQLFSASVTGVEGGANVTYGAEITNEDGSKSISLELKDNFYVDKDELESAVYSLWGRRPVARTIPVNVVGLVEVGKLVVAATASTTFTATPDAPVIEDAYYYVGAVNGWSDSDKTYKLTNGGGDVYDNPVFTILIPAPTNEDSERVDNWFKIAPESAYTSGNFWANLWGVATNGDESTSGKLVYGDVGAFNQPASDGAKFYRISVNMLDETYEIAPLNFGTYFYEIGNESGWGTSHALYGAAGDGKYQGYYYLDGEFKFKPNADNWDNDLEYVDGETLGGNLSASGASNCPDPGAGFYRIDLDAASLTYSLKKIEQVSIIGTANGNWDTDTDLTYNKDENCWEVTCELNAGEMKFRGNHNWDGDVDLGGSFDNLVHGGGNIAVEAGNYTIKLYISIAGKHKAVVKKN